METHNNLKVTNIFIYPLKSGHEINTKQSTVTMHGLLNDRILVILKKKTLKFITIRTHPKLYEIVTSFDSDNHKTLNLEVPNTEGTNNKYTINLTEELEKVDNEKILNTKIWSLPCDVHPIQNEELQKNLSAYIGEEVVIVFPIQERLLKDYEYPHQYNENIKETDTTHFADLAPLLITSEESLTYINELLEKKGEGPVKMINFRPNIVISGGTEPFWEDKINKIKIGNVVFRRIKGCVRCKLTTYDTDKKEFRKSFEPLEILGEVHPDDKLGGVIFGQNFCVDLDGTKDNIVKEGDEAILIE